MNDLTEKMKKKQLERGSYYYVKTKMGNILIDCINYDRPNHDGFLYDVEEVLAPVPSYEENARLKENDKIYSELAQVLFSLNQEKWVYLVKYGTREERLDFMRNTEKYTLFGAIDKNLQLRKLLQECHEYIVNTPILEQGSEQKTKERLELLDKIEWW